MKPGWVNKPLRDLFDIERGGSPRPIKRFLTDDEAGINWVRISDATASDKYIYRTEERIDPDGVRFSRLVKPGDFILSNSMSFGRPYVMRTTGCIHDGWLLIRNRDSSVDQDYLYHVLGSPLVFAQFDRAASGSTVRNLNIDLVRAVTIPVPPLPEQRRIVGILDQAFEGMALARANAERSLANSRAVFEQYRTAAFDGDGPRRSLDALVEAVLTGPFGSLLHKGDYVVGGTPVVNPIDIRDEMVSPLSTRTVSTQTTRRLKSYVLRQGDVVVGRRGEIGRCAVITEAESGWLCGTGCFIVRPGHEVDPYFLAHLIRSTPYRRRLQELSGRATMPSISNGDLAALKVRIPALSEQKRVVALLNDVRQQSYRLEALYRRKLIAFDELKQSLLHQAFSGNL